MRRFIKKHIPPFIVILFLFVLALTPSLSHSYISEVAAITDASGISSNQPASQPTDTLAEQSFAGLPLLFTKNVGQVDSSVSYYVKTTGQTAYLTNKGIIFDLVRYQENDDTIPARHEPVEAERLAFSIDFIGTKLNPSIEGRNIVPGKANFLTGSDPQNWYTDVPLYTEVLYRDLYPNIDLRFYDDGAGLRYDFIVNPGGNPADIMLAYNGIENLSLDGSELVATTAVGDIRQSRPVIYQGSEGRRIEVEGGFLLADENSYGFRIAGYNPAQTLIIDPSISYSSYFGGTGADYCYSVAVDGTYAYFTGYTNSTEASFPVKTGSYDITHNGGNDAFVAKINTASSGASSLIYCTYLGGSGDDEGIDIAVLDGETYITGRTKSDDFPTYNTTFYGSYHYNYDIFVTRLNAAGSGLLCSVYIGGQDIDYGESIYVSSADYVLIAGTTWSADITVSSAYQSTQQGNGDAYICKMDMTNGTHMWGSYFGGSGSDWGQDVTLSANSCPVLVGYTPGTDFPARTTGAYQTAYGGGNSDVFVVRFNGFPSGGILYHSYLGGSSGDYPMAIAGRTTDSTVYIGGTTWCSNYPTTANAYSTTDPSPGTSYYPSGFVSVLTMSGGGSSDLKYSTYFGSGNNTEIFDLALSEGIGYQKIWVTGYADDYLSIFPFKNNFQANYGGNPQDAFIAEFDPNFSGANSLLMSSFLGGSLEDTGYGIAAGSNRVCVVGRIKSTNFNTTSGYQTSKSTGYDGFITAITGVYPEIGVSPTSKAYGSIPVGSSSTQTFTISNTGTGVLYIDTLALQGTHANQFSIIDDNCSGQNVAPSSSRTFKVRFTPTAIGAKTAAVYIPNTDGDEGALFVNLNGTGVPAPGINVNPTGGLITTEAGGTANFTIVLNSQPTANVTISLSSSNITEGTVSPASVTFTTTNWDTTRTITITGVNDFVDDGNIAYNIVTAAATSTDPNYSGRNAPDVAVTNNDNDTVGFTIDPTSGMTTTEAGGVDTFTVKLNSQPTASVTIGLSSSNTGEGSVSPDSLTFTTSNWDTNQTVTVTGVNDFIDDGDIAYSIVTAPAASTDTKYNGLNPPDVSATNSDDDTAGFTVTPTSGLTTTEAGGTDIFTVNLTSQPLSDNVTIGLSSSTTGEGTVSPSSLIFTSTDWSEPQTVTITGVNDFIDDGDVPYDIVTSSAVSGDSTYHGLDPADVSVTNTDDDSSGFYFNKLNGLVTTESGGTDTVKIWLRSQPTHNVTLPISSNNINEGTVSPVELIFTPADWKVKQTVTVTGVDDAVADGNITYSVVTGVAVSDDPNYAGRNPANVGATNNDNDTPGITVSPTVITTSESGVSDNFTVVLNTQPTADVFISLSSSNTGEGTISTDNLTFTDANWDIGRIITVTGVDDTPPVMDGDIAYTIVLGPVTSGDADYNGISSDNVTATNEDNDAAGFTFTPSSGLVTSEALGTADFTVVLNTRPSNDVTIEFSSSDTSEGTVSPASLTFTPVNWDTPQQVTATGVDDLIADGNVAYTIVAGNVTSSDANYSAVDPPDIGAINNDNETAGITITPTSGLVTTEAGGTATFTVVLNTQPEANVSFGLSSSNTAEGTVSPDNLLFTTTNWNIEQMVTVTGVDDLIADGNTGFIITSSAAVSTDASYNGSDPADVTVTNNDNETPGITVNPTGGLITSEGGGTDTFMVVLNTQPAANVTLGLSSSDTTEGTVTPASLTFTATDWNMPQTVTVTGANDAVVDGAIAYQIITAAATSTDAAYNGFNASDVNAVNNDNDVNCATGTGTASFDPNTGTITSLTALAQTPCGAPPSGYAFPHGFFSFNITNIPAGSTVTITITLPTAIEQGTHYWKCLGGQWVNVTSLVGDDDGDNTLTLTITDGGLGDADGVGNGTITDPGGPTGELSTQQDTTTATTTNQSGNSLLDDSVSPYVRKPAQIGVKNINLLNKKVAAGQKVTIYANVVNKGDISGAFTTTLIINGEVEQTKTVAVNGNAAVPVQFTVFKDTPGTYNIEINGQQTRFTVTDSQKKSGTTRTTILLVLFIAVIFIGIGLIGLIIKLLPQIRNS